MNHDVTYFSVFDALARQYGPLFPAINDDVAKRMFKSLLKDVDSDELENYRLCKIFKFNDLSAEVSDCKLVVVCDGTFFAKKENSK